MKSLLRFKLHGLAVLLPICAILLGIAPHLNMLGGHVVMAHQYWWDAIGHMYLAWERFEALTFNQYFFDFRWFYPYANTGTYNEPAVTHGLLFGLINLVTPGEAWAFNLAMIAILALNAVALYLFIYDYVRRPWIAAVFATAGALSPFCWIRYAHPPNTVIFWGLLGLLCLRRASRSPTWTRCIAVPLMFVIQLYSSFYAGMFFLVPLILFLPEALARAHFFGNLKPLVIRAGIVSLTLVPLLLLLQISYANTRSELGTVNSYNYVSKYQRRKTKDLAPKTTVLCQLRSFGLKHAQKECREEMFPGRLVLISATWGLIFSGVIAVRRFKRRGNPEHEVKRAYLLAAGAVLSIIFGFTLPFHIGIWTVLALPFGPRGRILALANPIAVPIAASILVVDIALNPIINLAVRDLSSIHRFFFLAIPGFDGLRSEYRIIVFLPVFLSLIGAWSTRLILAFSKRQGSRRIAIPALTALSFFAVLDAQPMWQEYKPMPETTRASPVLKAAASLPPDSVFAVVKGDGIHIVRRKHVDANYWLGYIMLHRHRQITGYSTYNTPASEAIERAARIIKGKHRLAWVTRLTYLFGGTHLIIDWRDKRAPSTSLIKKMLLVPGNPKLVARDDHMALIGVGNPPMTAHGPVGRIEPPGPKLPTQRKIRASYLSRHLARIVDDNISTAWYGLTQRANQWIELDLGTSRCITGLGFSPGLKIERMPTSFVVEVKDKGEWRTVKEQSRWEIQQNLVTNPSTGLFIVPFEKTESDRIRLRLTRGSPWRWSLASIEVYSCKNDQKAVNY
ncbi:MAG: discoidin domain-containing protein [Proteobacteria bacterium]|nr:discoidin domain-containing protein [Pseudomonadota bacterium]